MLTNRTKQYLGTHNYSHLIVDKHAKSIHWRKDSICQNWVWEDYMSTSRKMKLGPIYHHAQTKLQMDLNKVLRRISKNC